MKTKQLIAFIPAALSAIESLCINPVYAGNSANGFLSYSTYVPLYALTDLNRLISGTGSSSGGGITGGYVATSTIPANAILSLTEQTALPTSPNLNDLIVYNGTLENWNGSNWITICTNGVNCVLTITQIQQALGGNSLAMVGTTINGSILFDMGSATNLANVTEPNNAVMFNTTSQTLQVCEPLPGNTGTCTPTTIWNNYPPGTQDFVVYKFSVVGTSATSSQINYMTLDGRAEAVTNELLVVAPVANSAATYQFACNAHAWGERQSVTAITTVTSSGGSSTTTHTNATVYAPFVSNNWSIKWDANLSSNSAGTTAITTFPTIAGGTAGTGVLDAGYTLNSEWQTPYATIDATNIGFHIVQPTSAILTTTTTSGTVVGASTVVTTTVITNTDVLNMRATCHYDF